MRIVITGGGDLGRLTAESLIHAGEEVVMVEVDAAVCESLAKRLDASIIHGDGTRPDILEKAEIVEADALAALSDSDQDNILTALVAKEYGVKRIAIKLNDPAFNMVCQKFGIQQIVNPKVTVAKEVADMVRGLEVLNLGTLVRGKARVYTTIVRDDAFQKRIADLELPEACLIAAVHRGDEFLVPRGGLKLMEGDQVTLLATEEALPELQAYFEPDETEEAS